MVLLLGKDVPSNDRRAVGNFEEWSHNSTIQRLGAVLGLCMPNSRLFYKNGGEPNVSKRSANIVDRKRYVFKMLFTHYECQKEF